MMKSWLDVQPIMIVNVLCYDFWYEVRCELVVLTMNVCDMEVVGV